LKSSDISSLVNTIATSSASLKSHDDVLSAATSLQTLTNKQSTTS